MGPSTAGDTGVLAEGLVPVPDHEAERALRAFGLGGRLTGLASERDQTFLVEGGAAGRFILKIAHPGECPDALRFQLGALRHLALSAPDLPLPRIVPRRDGIDDLAMAFADGTRRAAMLLSYLPGRPLHAVAPSPALRHDLGRVLGALDTGLAGYAAPAPARRLLWDLTHTGDLRALVGHVEASRRAQVAAVVERFEAETSAALARLPRQVIHNDLNPHNVLVHPEDDRVCGIIDFGDVVRAPRVNDLAIALSYHVGQADGLRAAASIVAGYRDAAGLAEAELALLPDLVAARLAMTIIIAEWRAALRPADRAYILRSHAGAVSGLRALAETPRAHLAALWRDAASDHPAPENSACR